MDVGRLFDEQALTRISMISCFGSVSKYFVRSETVIARSISKVLCVNPPSPCIHL